MGNYRRIIGLLIGVLFFLALVLARPFAAHSDNSLFHPVADERSIDTNAPKNILRGRAMRVNWNALSPDTNELSLNLFPDVALTAQLSRVDHSVTGGYVWVGELSGSFEGTAHLSVQDGVLSGSIFRLGREWGVIEYGGDALDDVYWVREIDPQGPEPNGVDSVAPPAEAVAAMAEVAATADLSAQGALCRDDGTVIDLMIVYTPQARAAVGGHEAMLALINQRVSEMNTINAVSGVSFGWRLVHAMEVNYVETGNIDKDRENLQARGDGLAEEIHAARDTYNADLVGMLISQGTGNTCGTAYRMDSLNYSFDPFSFSVTALNFGPYACSGLTLAHEFGHNLGNAHDRLNHSDTTLYGYSYGYQSPNNAFRTIMAYDCPGGCARIAQWANPDVWYQGEPTGVEYEVDPAQAADIVRSMENIHVEVANFRASCVPPTATPTNTLVPTSTPTPSLTPTLTTAPDASNTPTRTSVPTVTGTPPTPTRTLRPTATGRPTRTPQATATTAATPTSSHVVQTAEHQFLPFILRAP